MDGENARANFASVTCHSARAHLLNLAGVSHISRVQRSKLARIMLFITLARSKEEFAREHLIVLRMEGNVAGPFHWLYTFRLTVQYFIHHSWTLMLLRGTVGGSI